MKKEENFKKPLEESFSIENLLKKNTLKDLIILSEILKNKYVDNTF